MDKHMREWQERAAGQLSLWGTEDVAEQLQALREQAPARSAPRSQLTPEQIQTGRDKAIARLRQQRQEKEAAQEPGEQEPGWKQEPSRLELSSGTERHHREWLYQWAREQGWPAMRFQTRVNNGHPYYCTILGDEVSWRFFHEYARYEVLIQVVERAERGKITWIPM